MHRPNLALLAMLIVTAMLATPSPAQEEATSLPAELGWVKFRVSAGRLQVVNPNYRDSKTVESGNPLAGTSETFRVNGSADSATVHYRKQSSEMVLTVNFDSPDSVVIERAPAGDSPDAASVAAMKFEQDAGGRVRLIVGEGLRARQRHADSLWHLLLLAHDDAHEQLLPVLLSLRPGWSLAETAAGIEKSLVKLAESDARPDRRRWADLVEQLGSPSFQQRRSAQRQLREAGPAVVAYLRSLAPDTLDAERRARIAQLLSDLSSSTDDTPGRIAMWMIDDALIWTTVLESEAPAHRQIAKAQLESLLGREIEFDPEADTERRKQQAQALRATLGSK